MHDNIHTQMIIYKNKKKTQTNTHGCDFDKQIKFSTNINAQMGDSVILLIDIKSVRTQINKYICDCVNI